MRNLPNFPNFPHFPQLKSKTMTYGFRRLVLLAIFGSFIFSACGQGPHSIPPPETSARQSLEKAQTCGDIEERIVKAQTERFLEHYYEQQYRAMPGVAAESGQASADDSANSSGASKSSPNDYTETNNQVEGVDEADIIKTDGDFIYGVRHNKLLVVKSWPPKDTEIVGEYNLDNVDKTESDEKKTNSTSEAGASVARPGYNNSVNAQSLFLTGDKVAVFSRVHDNAADGEYYHGTRISIIDVSDRSNPELVNQLGVEGSLLSGRMIDGDVYLVSNSSVDMPSATQYGYNSNEFRKRLENILPPRPDHDTTDAERKRRANIARPIVRSELRDILANVDTEQLLPQKRLYNDKLELEDTANLFSCDDVYLPPNISELGILNISHFDLDAATDEIEVTNTGLMANGWEMYASKQNLYLALSNRAWRWGWGADEDSHTHIHKFGFTGQNDRPEYKASGEVDGWLLNQFSMSEHDGHLRVATTDNDTAINPQTGDREETGGNHLTILEEDGKELEETGSVRNMAPGERIYSVRMMGDKGYVVTFEQIDPLFTLDLSDPEHPEVMGELKITGFSTYMHPLGDDHLMAIGRAGTAQGNIQGVQLQIFDVSDMENPQRVHKETITTGRWSSYSEAMWEHHAFTYHPEKDMLAFPLNIHEWGANDGENFSGLVLYKANADIGFKEVGRIDHSEMVQNSHRWWTRIRRSIFIEDYVYSYGEAGLKVNELMSPENEMASVAF